MGTTDVWFQWIIFKKLICFVYTQKSKIFIQLSADENFYVKLTDALYNSLVLSRFVNSTNHDLNLNFVGQNLSDQITTHF